MTNLFIDGVLGIKVDEFFWTVVTFFVLLFVLAKFAWGPLLAALAKREASIKEAVESAQKLKQESERLVAEYQARIHQAQAEAKSIVDEGRRDGEALRKETLDKAREEAQASLERAKREISLATDSAIEKLRETTADLSIEIASKVVRKNLDSAENRRLVKESLASVETGARFKA
jgi:F-type H+-transporting ATPase subunit b